ncbi:MULTISPECIES: 4-hydroxy-tetrahydrodipicolinate synthase [Thalassospira]|uniref:4-hydroxy-tetrahydrodipicolinate synthase n=1 Tax=Thalassospira povalilytica TaxID=732237 RepID=A0A8I1SKR4_9PROT|nr:4-hydroxy-tetrahydrodipicolinate synthase [Thalassospira povalilytica]MBN8198233.1 4-hydroxy-tetrahydrodipicolinate synthase [Thalassospira povalilytica]PKR49164.1 4-hydroxy-tetrahydrodipicolinate synthase [Thalassospira povalilytica]
MTLTKNDISGLYTAIVTPFAADKSVDHNALAALVSRQLAAGATGIVPIGGTGEYPALSRQERKDIVKTCVEAAGDAPVIPGVLSTGFLDAVEAGKDFEAVGAAGVMTVTPYYAAGTQEGMREYFANYRNEVGVPVLLYEIPRRTTVATKAETIQAMAEDGSIIGMKCSNYDMPEFIKTMKFAGEKMAILSGEEPLFATHVTMGAKGGVLASANIYPEIWIEIFNLAREGKLNEALKLQTKLDCAIDAIYRETNPGPLKKYMEMAGQPVGDVRLPLQSPSQDTMAALKSAFDVTSVANVA